MNSTRLPSGDILGLHPAAPMVTGFDPSAFEAMTWPPPIVDVARVTPANLVGHLGAVGREGGPSAPALNGVGELPSPFTSHSPAGALPE